MAATDSTAPISTSSSTPSTNSAPAAKRHCAFKVDNVSKDMRKEYDITTVRGGSIINLVDRDGILETPYGIYIAECLRFISLHNFLLAYFKAKQNPTDDVKMEFSVVCDPDIGVKCDCCLETELSSKRCESHGKSQKNNAIHNLRLAFRLPWAVLNEVLDKTFDTENKTTTEGKTARRIAISNIARKIYTLFEPIDCSIFTENRTHANCRHGLIVSIPHAPTLTTETTFWDHTNLDTELSFSPTKHVAHITLDIYGRPSDNLKEIATTTNIEGMMNYLYKNITILQRCMIPALLKVPIHERDHAYKKYHLSWLPSSSP